MAFDPGGSPATPYFGPGGRKEAQTARRNEKGRKPSAKAKTGEAHAEATKRANKSQEENRTKADPRSSKAENFDTRSKNAAETGQKEPTGDPKVRQPGTAPKAPSDVEGTKSTTFKDGDNERKSTKARRTRRNKEDSPGTSTEVQEV